MIALALAVFALAYLAGKLFERFAEREAFDLHPEVWEFTAIVFRVVLFWIATALFVRGLLQ